MSATALLKQAASRLYYLSGLYKSYHKGKVSILTYHRVLSSEAADNRYVQPGMFVLDHVFERQILFLKQHFHILSFDDLLTRWKCGGWDDNQRYCVITFDDGWFDNYVYAYPVLRKYEVPATIFLPTNFIGTSEWFWPEKVAYLLEEAAEPSIDPRRHNAFWRELTHVLSDNGRVSTQPPRSNEDKLPIDDVIERCKRLPTRAVAHLIELLCEILGKQIPFERIVLNWNEVAEMSEGNISFGSHSCSHSILTLLALEEVRNELEQSDRVLRDQKINRVPVFCYPNGNSNREIQRLVQACGYEAAVGVQCGNVGKAPMNLFDIKRIGIHNDVTSTVPRFAFHLLAFHS